MRIEDWISEFLPNSIWSDLETFVLLKHHNLQTLTFDLKRDGASKFLQTKLCLSIAENMPQLIERDVVQISLGESEPPKRDSDVGFWVPRTMRSGRSHWTYM